MGIIGAIIIGIVAGWFTGMVMKGSGYGLIGALVGGWLTSVLFGVDLTSGFSFTTLVFALVGAVIVVATYRLVTQRSL